jgi:hypothetical protein
MQLRVLSHQFRLHPRAAPSWRRRASAPRLSTSRLRATGGTRRAMLESSFPRICFDLHFRADRRIAEQMIACLYALPRTEPLTPLSQTHSGTKWFGKPSPDRSSVGASSLVWPCAGCAFKSKSPDAIATKRLELSIVIRWFGPRKSRRQSGEVDARSKQADLPP